MARLGRVMFHVLFWSSVFNAGEDIGAVAISNTGASGPGTAAVQFTLTWSVPGTVGRRWTVGGGSLQAQRGSCAVGMLPPPGG